jgi:A-macroglobulin receptor binding domain
MVQTKNLGTVLIVYYDFVIRLSERCFVAEAVRTSEVALLQPAAINVYDYFDNCKFSIIIFGVFKIECFHFHFSKTSHNIL